MSPRQQFLLQIKMYAPNSSHENSGQLFFVFPRLYTLTYVLPFSRVSNLSHASAGSDVGMISSRFDGGWSSAHPVIADLRGRELAIREEILSRGHSISTNHLLQFVQDIVSSTQTFIDNGDFSLAEVTALRAEILLRNPAGARRRYNDEDWLNLGVTTGGNASVAQQRLEQSRVALLAQTLQHIAFIFKMLERYETAKLALLDAVALQGGVMRPQTMLNLLSIICHLPEEEETTIHVASEAVHTLAYDLEALLAPSLSSVLVNGTIAQRNAYSDQRHLAATLLVTAHLYLADAARFRFIRRSDARGRCPGRLYSLHRVTLAYAELQRLALQEIAEDHHLHEKVGESISDWSFWLAESAWGSKDERNMSNEKSERWKFQVRRSRQFAVMHSISVDGEYPALESIYLRSPHSVGVALLLFAGGDPGAAVAAAAPPTRGSVSQEEVEVESDEPVAKALEAPETVLVARSLERQLADVPKARPTPPVAINLHTERNAYIHLSSFVSAVVPPPRKGTGGATASFKPATGLPIQAPKPVSAVSGSAVGMEGISRSDIGGVQKLASAPSAPSNQVPALGPAPVTTSQERDRSPEPILATTDGNQRYARRVMGPVSGPASADFTVPQKQAPLPKRRAPSDSAH
jgi:hypothetical protein